MGQSPTQLSGAGFTPLHFAVYGESEEVTTYLLTEYADEIDVNYAPQGTGLTPVFLSVKQSTARILSIIFKCGAHITKEQMKSEAGMMNPVNYAIQKRNYNALLVLLENGGWIQTTDDKHYSPLMKAVANNLVEAIEPFIDAGCNVNYCTDDGRSALSIAIAGKNEQIVKLLLSYGADATLRDVQGQTMVHKAAAAGSYDILKAVLDAGANPLKNDNTGKTPLHYVFSSPNPLPLIKLLIDYGVDINFYSKTSGTVLGNVLVNKKLGPEVIEFLLENGADLFLKALNGKTYYQIAQLCSDKKVILPIVEKYAKIQQAEMAKRGVINE